ncbi:hypothetical protein T484DRAFT_1925906 [Baffinella frigidus]|nr:hypothetical protein T484DRAFT_1925906 [Cryptophyta sp. CCMP2293]
MAGGARLRLHDSQMKCMVCQLTLLDGQGQPCGDAADYARVGTQCPHPCCTGCLAGAMLAALPGLYSCPHCSDAGYDAGQDQYTRWRRRDAGEDLSSEVVQLASGVRRGEWVLPDVLRDELWTASSLGRVEEVRLLLADGANAEGPGGQFKTNPIDEAFAQDHGEIIDLLGGGANLSTRSFLVLCGKIFCIRCEDLYWATSIWRRGTMDGIRRTLRTMDRALAGLPGWAQTRD